MSTDSELQIGKVKVKTVNSWSKNNEIPVKGPEVNVQCRISEDQIRSWVKLEIKNQVMGTLNDKVERLEKAAKTVEISNAELGLVIVDVIDQQLQEKIVPLIQSAVEKVLDRIERGPKYAAQMNVNNPLMRIEPTSTGSMNLGNSSPTLRGR